MIHQSVYKILPSPTQWVFLLLNRPFFYYLYVVVIWQSILELPQSFYYFYKVQTVKGSRWDRRSVWRIWGILKIYVVLLPKNNSKNLPGCSDSFKMEIIFFLFLDQYLRLFGELQFLKYVLICFFYFLLLIWNLANLNKKKKWFHDAGSLVSWSSKARRHYPPLILKIDRFFKSNKNSSETLRNHATWILYFFLISKI